MNVRYRKAASHTVRLGAVLAAVLLLPACVNLDVGGPEVDDIEFEVIAEAVFASSLGIDLTQMIELPEGVYILDKTDGTGEPVDNDSVVTISYVGWLRSGAEFDRRGQFTFTIGVQEVIPGFEIGILGMRKGGTRLIIIPPELAYGAQAVGNIPPGSILIFEVELTEHLPG